MITSAGAHISALIRALWRTGPDAGLDTGDRVVQGPVGGRLHRVVACKPLHQKTGLFSSSALTSTVLAFTTPDCHRGPGSVINLLDLGSGRTTRIDAVAVYLTAAGRYIAWIDLPAGSTSRNPLDAHDIVVRDADPAGGVLYRVPADRVPAGVADLTLAPDGTVAFTYFADGTSSRLGLGWASPAEPYFHPVPVDPRPFYEPQLSGKELAFRRTTARAAAAGASETELLRGPLGGPFQVVATPVVKGFDSSGTRMTWMSPRCRGVTVVEQLTSDPPMIRNSTPRCALRLNRGPRRAGHGHFMRLVVACSGFDFSPTCGETASIAVRTRSRHWTKVATGPIRTAGRALVPLHGAARRIAVGQRIRIIVESTDLAGRRFVRSGIFAVRRR